MWSTSVTSFGRDADVTSSRFFGGKKYIKHLRDFIDGKMIGAMITYFFCVMCEAKGAFALGLALSINNLMNWY